jgi:O-antigen/teichoic acid export membrane protein
LNGGVACSQFVTITRLRRDEIPSADEHLFAMSTRNGSDQLAPSSSRWRPDSLASSVAILLVVSVVQRSIGFGRGILFCRWLEPEQLGEWDMAYGFLLLAAPVVVLGLPGSFGRYLERYRQQNQLRTFLRRSAAWTALLVTMAVAAIVWAAPSFSTLVFGRPDRPTLTLLMAASLAAVILHHFLEAVFAGLRNFRVVSAMQFCQSLLFATISLSLMWWWKLAAESVVIGYGAACLISSVGTIIWKGPLVAEVATPDLAQPHADFWPPLVRFAIWIWVTNLLSQLFGVVDRYMLVHWSGMDAQTALAAVGNYHSSRIVPLLLISVADLLAGVVMPYLSHDWERGERRRVSERLNLVLKLTSLGMLAAGVVVLWAAPLLFQVAFQGKYDGGLAVLPWTLTYSVWVGLAVVAQNFIWCAEKTKIGVVPTAIGLGLNVLLNLALLPIWGLLGAVVATTVSTAAALGALYWLNRREGMQLQAGLWWLTAAPAALIGGPWVATVVLAVLIVVALSTRLLFSSNERTAMTELVRQQFDVLGPLAARFSKSKQVGT